MGEGEQMTAKAYLEVDIQAKMRREPLTAKCATCGRTLVSIGWLVSAEMRVVGQEAWREMGSAAKLVCIRCARKHVARFHKRLGKKLVPAAAGRAEGAEGLCARKMNR